MQIPWCMASCGWVGAKLQRNSWVICLQLLSIPAGGTSFTIRFFIKASAHAAHCGFGKVQFGHIVAQGGHVGGEKSAGNMAMFHDFGDVG